MIIFILLTGLVVVTQKGWLEKPEIDLTPTIQTILLEALPFDELISIKVIDNGQVTLELSRPSSDGWVFVYPQNLTPDASKVEQLIASLYGLSPTTVVSSSTPLESLGISPESRQIILIGSSLTYVIIHLGSLTPTSSGYYIQVDNHPAVVVSKYGLQDVLDLLQSEALQITEPTP